MHIGDCHHLGHQPKFRAPGPDTDNAEGAAPSDTFKSSSLSESAKHGFDLANLDTSVRPQDDFYQYAVGGFVKTHPIPDNKSSVGSFDTLAEANRTALHNILEDLSKSSYPAGSDEQKLADFYASGMDTAAIEAAGTKPLAPIFAAIDGITGPESLRSAMADLQNKGLSAVFGLGAEQDIKNSTQTICGVGQGGLGLPEREFYFNQDEKSKEIRTAYHDHIVRTFELLGDSPEAAAQGAEKVMKFETELAGASMTMADLRDPEKSYHIMNRQQLAELTPNFDWNKFLDERGVKNADTLNMSHPDFFKKVNSMIVETPVEDWKSYLRWHAISGTSWALDQKFGDENFEFAKVLSGVKTKNDRWKKIVSATEGTMGDALGRKFVETNFSPESKKRVQDMLSNIRGALRDDLKTLPWMTEKTRGEATKKLDTIMEKIGYPDKWQDYSQLEINRGPFVENVLRSNEWATKLSLEKIGKPADPTEWGMSPPTVNAYYNPLNNEIVFPAGILQPPFFNPDADDAVNYGAIGVVIGHEITHGFDDSGAQFDSTGNLRDWWLPDDKARFQERTNKIIDQANNFAVGDLHLNGPVVVGEATADLGGVELALQALKRSTAGKPAGEKIDGFTPEQRFFLGFAQVWAKNTRPEAERQQITTDPHPVSEFRVNGTLSNVPEFAQAFGAKAGDKMVRPDELRTILWEAPAA